MDNDDQIQQEQERDFKRAVSDIERLLGRIEKRARDLHGIRSPSSRAICDDVDELRNLIKMIGG